MPTLDSAHAYVEPRREVDSSDASRPALVEEFHQWHLRLYASLDEIETSILQTLRREAEAFVRRLQDEVAVREAGPPASEG